MLATSTLNNLKKRAVIKPLNEDDLLYPKFYISTGNYAVNKIISGSVFRGIPNNRITTFYGESGCVPFEAKIHVLVKPDVEITEKLSVILDDSPFEHIFDDITSQEKISLLLAIGYSQLDIARRTGLSRQSVYLHRTGRVGKNLIGRRVNNAENSAGNRLIRLLNKNIFCMPIHAIKLLKAKKIKFLVLTPYGFRRCSNIIDKGEKDSYAITITDCPTTYVSKDHLIQLEDGKFEFAENIFNEHSRNHFKPLIRTIYGPRSLLQIREVGLKRMCDIEIQDEHHSYFADCIAGHNSGKSLIVTEIIINAIKEKKFKDKDGKPTGFDAIFYLDSEAGILPDAFQEALDEDEMSRIYHVPMESLEQCTTFLANLYDDLRAQFDAAKGDPNKEPHVMVVLDSLSGLFPEALREKAKAEKNTTDMGAIAKARNQMTKSMMMPVAITGCPFVVICHAYKNLNAMGPQKFDVMSGGEGIRYAAHIVIQSKSAKKRQEDASLGLKGGNSYYEGNLIRYITFKDRLVVEGLEATMMVDYATGIKKYDGLWDDAIRLGFIKQLGAWYQVPSWKDPNQKFRRDQIAENKEIWDTFLPKMDEIFKVETSYRKKDRMELQAKLQAEKEAADKAIDDELVE